MSTKAAGWVRRHAWTTRARRGYRPDLDHLCACQMGPVWPCIHGLHQECTGRPDWPIGGVCAETYILDTDGSIRWHPETARVWVSGCCGVWRCSCACHTAPAPAPPKGPRQAALFDIGGAR